MRCVAVDWSGAAAGAARRIWIAEVLDGTLVALDCGRNRSEAIDHLIAIARDGDGGLVAGLDFSFSFPAWYCAARGWATAGEVWDAMAAEGEALLAACAPPFWGRPGRRRPSPRPDEPALRRDEAAHRAIKSTFQIGGAGAVGTGSIRGMPHLRALRAAGFAVWPFDAQRAGEPTALEIYPRALTGPVVKSRPAARQAYLAAAYPALAPSLRTRAACTEDAFDAAVSALVMDAHAAELEALPATADPVTRLEGRIWSPRAAPRTRPAPLARA